ncbi:hypothetical protein LCGC14_3156870 [marine sediment metagenome]|uniref:DksA C4-type domain-containing protein n=1 Tax=marine sediment metagenome TaxID=412755 RepID=A0A0F8YGV4_9ZZZZ
MCVSEERIREIAREEYQKLLNTEQDACKHEVQGTLHEDGSTTCDTCGKLL